MCVWVIKRNRVSDRLRVTTIQLIFEVYVWCRVGGEIYKEPPSNVEIDWYPPDKLGLNKNAQAVQLLSSGNIRQSV